MKNAEIPTTRREHIRPTHHEFNLLQKQLSGVEEEVGPPTRIRGGMEGEGSGSTTATDGSTCQFDSYKEWEVAKGGRLINDQSKLQEYKTKLNKNLSDLETDKKVSQEDKRWLRDDYNTEIRWVNNRIHILRVKEDNKKRTQEVYENFSETRRGFR